MLRQLPYTPHAAAAHLAQQPEVAQLAGGRPRRRLSDLGGGGARPRGGAADEAEGGQAGVEVVGQLGVAGQELLARRRRAGLGGGQVLLQRPRHAVRRRRWRAVLLLHRGSLGR
jgi:hypothetical protein